MAGAKNYKVYGAISNSRLTKVSELINHSSRSLVRNTFVGNVTKKILRIPLAETEHKDLVVWRCELTAVFSMRSAYKILLDSNRDLQILEMPQRPFTRDCGI